MAIDWIGKLVWRLSIVSGDHCHPLDFWNWTDLFQTLNMSENDWMYWKCDGNVISNKLVIRSFAINWQREVKKYWAQSTVVHDVVGLLQNWSSYACASLNVPQLSLPEFLCRTCWKQTWKPMCHANVVCKYVNGNPATKKRLSMCFWPLFFCQIFTSHFFPALGSESRFLGVRQKYNGQNMILQATPSIHCAAWTRTCIVQPTTLCFVSKTICCVVAYGFGLCPHLIPTFDVI